MPAATAKPESEPRFDRAQAALLWQEAEWRRCAADPQHFIENYVYVKTKDGLKLFKLWDYQRELHDLLMNNLKVIILKARQLGITTQVVVGYAMWMLLFWPRLHNIGATILMFSKSKDDAMDSMERMRMALDMLPMWMHNRFERTSDAKGTVELKFPDGHRSMMKAQAGGGQAGASKTADLLLLDEFALIRDSAAMYNTAEPAVDHAMKTEGRTNAAMVVFSTARGSKNIFAKLYKAADRGVNGFASQFIPWFRSPVNNPRILDVPRDDTFDLNCLEELDEAGYIDWTTYNKKKQEREEMGEPWRIHSEYPATKEEAFLESGARVFRHIPEIEQCEEFPLRGHFVLEDEDDRNTVQFVRDQPDADDELLSAGPWRLAEKPQAGTEYVMSCDPSTGTGGDYASAVIMRADEDRPDEYHIVAFYHSNSRPDNQQAVDFELAGRWFNDAWLTVERQGGYGSHHLNVLFDNDYPSLYRDKPSARRNARRASDFGHNTQWKKKVQRVLQLRGLWSQNKLHGVFPLLREEMLSFVVKETPSGNEKFEAESGAHDDLIDAWTMAVELCTQLDTRRSPNPPVSEDDRVAAIVALLGEDALVPSSQRQKDIWWAS